ncbi:beta-carotene 15,15'-dioxygenase, Brp/Blh family [Flavobacteriaceae bacterium TP-CH-4]|uniref:Probable beta-carotene 15,15'-dioxygenase n=1 Tax=Pelagihabitans pacificus TaxID=2696054 RepID=A0A967ECE4_9FLAO|nr:Brp/Blh family beta-carotene 15,15'-dioxygenase [Pelagihabitans pacificus]NHF58188.1 beta-carotene 15,15'-dioxygenase, Brp/Blh family [Pelagihabitans pacificus]
MKNEPLYFSKLTNIAIVATFFALWIAIYFSNQVENTLAYVLILTFGMLHGANDLKLIQKSTKEATGGTSFAVALSLYVLVVLLGFGLFYWFPSFAFVLFIVVSGYHFGEQHWVSKIDSTSFSVRVFYLSYGLLVLGMLFDVHQDAVTEVIDKITGHQIPADVYQWLLWISAAVFALLYLFLYTRKSIHANLIKQLFFLLVFFVVFNTASLLWSFAIYFILWHSLPSIADQIIFLYGNLSSDSFLGYVKSSFIYWLVAAVGAGFLLFFLKDDMETSLSFFLAFLAAITFPHVLVIGRLNHH